MVASAAFGMPRVPTGGALRTSSTSMATMCTTLIGMVSSTAIGVSSVPAGGVYSPELDDGYDYRYSKYVVKEGIVGRDDFTHSYG